MGMLQIWKKKFETKRTSIYVNLVILLYSNLVVYLCYLFFFFFWKKIQLIEHLLYLVYINI